MTARARDPLAPFVPDAARPFDLRLAGHLLRRAGYGGSLPLRRELVRLGVDAAVTRVVGDLEAPPADPVLPLVMAGDDVERVRAWRVHRALHGEPPLALRTAAFWHDHFATSNRKLLDPRAMAVQMQLFDRLGLQRFDDLLAAVSRDPAMLRWLDSDRNSKAEPNENFARELFELFALGRGPYGERDVREAARAFTGWHVRDGAFRFVAADHDRGDKLVLGERGAWTGDDVVRIAAARGESALFLAGKWLRWFVHPEPDQAAVQALADCYVRHGHHVGRTLQVLLRSELFFAASSLRSKIKSPAEFVLGLVRGLGARAAARDLAAAMASLGEAWLEPPSVEGWPEERAWLSGASWIQRSNFAADLLHGRRGKLAPAVANLFAAAGTPAERCKLALLVLLDGDVSEQSRARLLTFAGNDAGRGPDAPAAILHAATCLPEYQLL